MPRPLKNSAAVTARIPGDLKAKGDAILERDGITQSDAVRLIWAEMVRRDRFPFSVETVLKDLDAAE